MKGRRTSNFPTNTGDRDSMKLRTRDSFVSLKRAEDEALTPSHVFTLTENEIERQVFQLRYHSLNDAYYRLGSDTPAIQGWEKGIYAAVNIDRHVQDELVYLTRKSGHREASISWKVDLTDTGLVVDSIQALTLSRTLNGGIVTYDIISPDAQPDIEQLGYVTNGWQTIYLIAYLSGGNCQEQTQLLYQDCLDDQNTFPLDILLTLKPLQEILCTCERHSEQFSHMGIQDFPQVHSATIEKCPCYFPYETPNISESSNNGQRTPFDTTSFYEIRTEDSNAEPLSVVDKHRISLPGTPVHRKEYGRKISAGSHRSHNLNKRNRVKSKVITPAWDQVSYDNPGMELPKDTHVHKGHHVTSGSESELRVLEAGNLELMRESARSKTAWPDRRQRDNTSLVVEEDTHTRHFCNGSLCTIS